MTPRPAPTQIGPYRIEARLGAGGMGEVYTAWDDRLGRRVAIKMIRPEVAGTSAARERFQREARAAGALNHPAIVQIYDIVSSDEGDALVLEHVVGQTLDRRLAERRLSLEEALKLGADVASALAEAHAHGIVHRDLKPGNVMVTASGAAKVLDFGIAKRLAEGAPEHTLSEDGVVVGTPWAMSPEQARGLEVDHRSDLFALGALLYEALTGKHPFRVKGTLDTLTRICTHCQPPAAELEPSIPAEVSELLDQLLEKDPARRPQSSAEVATFLKNAHLFEAPTVSPSRWSTSMAPLADGKGATLLEGARVTPPAGVWRWRSSRTLLLAALGVVTATLVGLGVLAPGEPQAPLVVAALAPELGGSPSATAGEEAHSLRAALLSGLLGYRDLSTPAPEQVDEIKGSPVEVARALAADEVLASQLVCDQRTCQITLNRIAGETGMLLWTKTFQAPLREPFLLAEAVRGYLRSAYSTRQERRGAGQVGVRPEDYQRFLDLERETNHQDETNVDPETLFAELERIRESSPRFLEAWVLEAQQRRFRFGAKRDPRDLARARDLLEEARELAPDDPRPLTTAFELALTANDPEAAAAALAELTKLQPGDPNLLSRKARLLERQGQAELALAEMQRAAEELPSWQHLFRLADMEYRLGAQDAARATLGKLLERFPGSYSGRSLLAQIDLLSGKAEEAENLYARLVAEHASMGELVNLGIAQLLLSRYREAAATTEKALALEPDNPWAVLNLADASLLAGDAARAQELYERVLALVARDPAASHWSLLSLKAQALAHLGRREEAVAVVQRLLGTAEDNAQAAYEAALVYALVGDRSSALVNATRAAGKGVAPRWFTLPWFAELTAEPEMQRILQPQP